MFNKYFIKKIIRAFLCLWSCLIFVVPIVNAETRSPSDFSTYECSDKNLIPIYSEGSSEFLPLSESFIYDESTNLFSYNPISTRFCQTSCHMIPSKFIQLLPDTSYNIYVAGASRTLVSNYIYFFDKEYNYISKILIKYPSSTSSVIANFTTPSSSDSHILAIFSISAIYLNGRNLVLVSSTYSYSLDEFNSEPLQFNSVSCPWIKPIAPDTPDNPSSPDGPSISETDQSKIFSNFFTIFLDRLKYVSGYAISSPIFLGFIGVFIIFIVLELFLFLFNKGGYK